MNINSQIGKSGFKAGLVNPPDYSSSVFPLGVSQIVSVFRLNGIDVKVFDNNREKFTPQTVDRTVERLLAYAPDILSFSGMQHNFDFISQVSSRYKQAFPDSLIIGGGHWCAWAPEFSLNHTACDIIVNGEGDIPLDEVCKVYPDLTGLKDIKGLTFMEDGEIINTGVADVVIDLSTLPGPEFELFDYMKNYVTRRGDRIATSVQRGRGCIAKCSFCTAANIRYRTYTTERIVNEVRHVRDTYGVNFVKFSDPLTLVSNRRSKDFVQALIDADLGLNYSLNTRVDALDEEMVSLLKEVGVVSVTVGIETGDSRMMNEIMKKNLDINKVREGIRLCNKAGIELDSGFIVGMPGENLRSVFNTMKFIFQEPVCASEVYLPIPYPGTDLYKYALKNLDLTEKDILTDPLINIGYRPVAYNYKEIVTFLKKYRFTYMHPTITYGLYRMIARLLWIRKLQRDGKYLAVTFRTARWFLVDIGFELCRAAWSIARYRNDIFRRSTTETSQTV